MNKLWLRASIRSTLSTLALLGFVHCTGQANQESPHDEVGLFDAQSAMQVDVTLKRTKDEEIPYHPTDEFWNVDDDGKRMEAIVRKSEEGDYGINLPELRSLTSCRLPSVNLRRKTLLFTDEWFVFTYCHLNILAVDAMNKPIFPNRIPSFRNKISAFNFINFAAQKYLEQHLHGNRGLSVDNKLELFRKIFLVSKFRGLTINETKQAESLIKNFGLYFTTQVYLTNWYLSSFYHRHLDFSKDPQAEYESLEIFGTIKDTAGNLLNDVFFETQNTSAGFRVSGYSKIQSQIEIGTKCAKDVSPAGSNFAIQYYEIRHSAKKHKNRHLRKKKSKTEALEFYGYFKKEGFNSELKSVLLDGTCTKALHVILKSNAMPPARAQSWPDINRTTIPDFDSLSWSVNLSGALEGCKKPSFYPSGQVVDAFYWQDFATCLLKLGMGTDYYPLVSPRSSFDYVFQTKEIFKKSDAAIFLSEPEMLGKIYQILTFRSVTDADLRKMSAAIESLGFDAAFNYLIATWYYRSAGAYFNYSLKPTIGVKRTRVDGVVRDVQNKQIMGATLLLTDSLGQIVSTAISDAFGKFSLTADILRPQSATPFRLEIKHEGFAAREYDSITLDTAITQDVVLVPLGQIGPEGGQIITPNVTIIAPPLAADTTINFQVTPIQVAPDASLEGLPRTSFTITPDFKFNNYVTLKIQLPLDMLSFDPGDAYVVASKISPNVYEQLETFFDRNTNIITAKTVHFSEFVVLFRSTLSCYLSAAGLNVCVPRNDTYETHPLASILEKRISKIPEEMPFLRPYSKNILRNGGWNEAIAGKLDDPATFVDNGFAAECATGNCPPIVKEFNLPQPASQYGNWSIPATAIHLSTSSSGTLDIQAEQCRVNPLASEPQINLLSVQSSNINVQGTIPISGITFSFEGYRSEHECKEVWPITYCWDNAVGTTITETFSHTANLQLTNYDSSYNKDRASIPPQWLKGKTFSPGIPNIDVGSLSDMPDRTYTLCYDGFGCYDIGINNTIRDRYISGYKDNFQKHMKNKIYENIDESLLSQLQQTHDPVWNDTNCFANQLFSVSGSIMGSSGPVVINLNNLEDLTLTANGAFYFSTQLPNNTNYEVLIKQNPPDQGCMISNKSGIINGINITNIVINCQTSAPNGTTIDVNTGRTWTKCTLGQSLFSPSCEAGPPISDCSILNSSGGTGLGGFRDWRAPTLNELKSLVDCANGKSLPLANRDNCGTGFSSPTINQQAFPNTKPNWYWTSSEILDNNLDTLWLVNFGNGFSTPFVPESYWRFAGGVGPRPPWVINDSESIYYRCVRGP